MDLKEQGTGDRQLDSDHRLEELNRDFFLHTSPRSPIRLLHEQTMVEGKPSLVSGRQRIVFHLERVVHRHHLGFAAFGDDRGSGGEGSSGLTSSMCATRS